MPLGLALARPPLLGGSWAQLKAHGHGPTPSEEEPSATRVEAARPLGSSRVEPQYNLTCYGQYALALAARRGEPSVRPWCGRGPRKPGRSRFNLHSCFVPRGQRGATANWQEPLVCLRAAHVEAFTLSRCHQHAHRTSPLQRRCGHYGGVAVDPASRRAQRARDRRPGDCVHWHRSHPRRSGWSDFSRRAARDDPRLDDKGRIAKVPGSPQTCGWSVSVLRTFGSWQASRTLFSGLGFLIQWLCQL